jgi:hypothetical protein
MIKFIIGGFVIFALMTIFPSCSREDNKKEIVLGQETARASEKEKERIKSGNFKNSPMPDFNYMKWPNERSLINPIENELDSSIMKLCLKFKRYKEGRRNEVRRSISQDEIYTLMTFCKRATIFGIRNNKPSYIEDGFVAISMIESERCDYRDVLVTLGFLNYGIEKLNLNAVEFYGNAIRLSEPNTAELIEVFSNRPAEDRKLETMSGYTPFETDYGIGFIGWRYEEYNPKHNLAKTILEVSDYVTTDKYRTGSISIGEKIPSIWLGADNDKKIEVQLSKTSGCSSLHTELRDEFHPKSKDQMLLIFLAEFDEKEAFETLMQQINSNIPKTYIRLGFREGNIFCLVIARSTRVGVEDFETNQSIKRLESPIRKIIKKNN